MMLPGLTALLSDGRDRSKDATYSASVGPKLKNRGIFMYPLKSPPEP